MDVPSFRRDTGLQTGTISASWPMFSIQKAQLAPQSASDEENNQKADTQKKREAKLAKWHLLHRIMSHSWAPLASSEPS